MEKLLKEISKHFQMFVCDLSPEEVSSISDILKREKETLVRVRALIPSRMQQFHQLQTQRESLEKGVVEIVVWLDAAEEFLHAHAASDKSMESVQASLDRHQAYFSRLVNYKLLLDDMCKVFQYMAKPAANNGQNTVRNK